MSEHGFAYFISNPRQIEDLMREREYEVVKTICLSEMDFENFVTDMEADRQFLEDNSALCGKNGAEIRCLKVTRKESSESVLVVPDGSWVDIAALLLEMR